MIDLQIISAPIQDIQSSPYNIQPDTAGGIFVDLLCRIEHIEYFKMYLGFLNLKKQADSFRSFLIRTMLKGIFNKRDEQHRGDTNVIRLSFQRI